MSKTSFSNRISRLGLAIISRSKALVVALAFVSLGAFYLESEGKNKALKASIITIEAKHRLQISKSKSRFKKMKVALRRECVEKIDSIETKNKNDLNKLRKSYKKKEDRHSQKIHELNQKHRRQLTREKSKSKAQRASAAIPILGWVAVVSFEKMDFDHWKESNPNGTINQYTKETSVEVTDFIVNETKEIYEETKKVFSKVATEDHVKHK